MEFGRLQARDMLQHLWTGPISNAAVDVVQGSRSVEVRPVGVTKVCSILKLYKMVQIGFLLINFYGFDNWDQNDKVNFRCRYMGCCRSLFYPQLSYICFSCSIRTKTNVSSIMFLVPAHKISKING